MCVCWVYRDECVCCWVCRDECVVGWSILMSAMCCQCVVLFDSAFKMKLIHLVWMFVCQPAILSQCVCIVVVYHTSSPHFLMGGDTLDTDLVTHKMALMRMNGSLSSI